MSPLQIQFSTTELKLAEEFCRKCLLKRVEIEKLFDCGFFEYELGRVVIDKAGGKIKVINKPKEWRWNK
jgi:hypothetical protein